MYCQRTGWYRRRHKSPGLLGPPPAAATSRQPIEAPHCLHAHAGVDRVIQPAIAFIGKYICTEYIGHTSPYCLPLLLKLNI